MSSAALGGKRCGTEGCDNEVSERAIYCRDCAKRRQKESEARHKERKRTGQVLAKPKPNYNKARRAIGKTVSFILDTEEFASQITTESEIFNNVFYVVKNGELHIYSYQNDKLNVLAGRMPEFKKLVQEVQSVLDVWEDIRT